MIALCGRITWVSEYLAVHKLRERSYCSLWNWRKQPVVLKPGMQDNMDAHEIEKYLTELGMELKRRGVKKQISTSCLKDRRRMPSRLNAR